MSKQGSPTLIGSFVIGAIAITVFTLLTVGNLSLNEKTYRCVLYFQGSLHGLDIGAPVTYRGVTIGKVGKIAIDFNQEKNRYTIPVYIDIQEQTGTGTTHYQEAGFDTPEAFFRNLIARGLRAKLKMKSIVTGKLYIEFFFAPKTKARLYGDETQYIEIPTLPSGLDQFTQTLEELPLKDMIDKTIAALDSINRILSSKELKKTIPLFNTTLSRMDKLAATLERQVPNLAHDLKKTLADISGLTTSTQKVMEETGANISPLIDRLQTSFDTMNHTLDKLLTVADNLARLTDTGSPLEYELHTTLQDISRTARSISQLTDYLQRHPNALLTGRKEHEQ